MMPNVVLTADERDKAMAFWRENRITDPASITLGLKELLKEKKLRLRSERVKQPTTWYEGRIIAADFRALFHSLSAKYGTEKAKDLASQILHKTESAIRRIMHRWDFDLVELEPEYARAFFREATGFDPGPRT